MCFSAEASFGASAVIATIGVVAIRKAENPPEKVFAFIPVLFAIQQFTEGILWINLSGANYSGWAGLTTHIFLFFAWVIWPFYIPFAIHLLEQNNKQKVWTRAILVIGVIISLCLTYVLLFHSVKGIIASYHIKYTLNFEFDFPFLFGVFYFIPIVISLFVSSIKRMWVVGLMALVSFIISALFFQEHLISVWCFFAAIVSLTVLWVVYGQKRKSELHTVSN